VANTSLLVREEIARAAPTGGFRLFVFWSPASRGSATVPVALPRWHRLLAGSTVGLARNHPASHIGDGEGGCVDELISADAEPLCSLATRLRDELQAPGEWRLVLTRAVVLHDAPSP
jgi:hypothetical protein